MSLPSDQSGSGQDLLSVGAYGSLSERLSKMRHDINGRLSVVAGTAEILQMKPDAATAAQWLPRIATQPQSIKELMGEFSRYFEQNAALIDQLSLVLPKLKYSSPQQAESARAALAAQKADVERLEAQLAEARAAALEAALADPLDEDRLRALALKAAEVEVELAVLRTRALASLNPPLSAAQRQNIRDAAKP